MAATSGLGLCWCPGSMPQIRRLPMRASSCLVTWSACTSPRLMMASAPGHHRSWSHSRVVVCPWIWFRCGASVVRSQEVSSSAPACAHSGPAASSVIPVVIRPSRRVTVAGPRASALIAAAAAAAVAGWPSASHAPWVSPAWVTRMSPAERTDRTRRGSATCDPVGGDRGRRHGPDHRPTMPSASPRSVRRAPDGSRSVGRTGRAARGCRSAGSTVARAGRAGTGRPVRSPQPNPGRGGPGHRPARPPTRRGWWPRRGRHHGCPAPNEGHPGDRQHHRSAAPSPHPARGRREARAALGLAPMSRGRPKVGIRGHGRLATALGLG